MTDTDTTTTTALRIKAGLTCLLTMAVNGALDGVTVTNVAVDGYHGGDTRVQVDPADVHEVARRLGLTDLDDHEWEGSRFVTYAGVANGHQVSVVAVADTEGVSA